MVSGENTIKKISTNKSAVSRSNDERFSKAFDYRRFKLLNATYTVQKILNEEYFFLKTRKQALSSTAKQKQLKKKQKELRAF